MYAYTYVGMYIYIYICVCVCVCVCVYAAGVAGVARFCLRYAHELPLQLSFK